MLRQQLNALMPRDCFTLYTFWAQDSRAEFTKAAAYNSSTSLYRKHYEMRECRDDPPEPAEVAALQETRRCCLALGKLTSALQKTE